MLPPRAPESHSILTEDSKLVPLIVDHEPKLPLIETICHFGDYQHAPRFNSTVIGALEHNKAARITKVTAHFGPQDPAYEQALLTHHQHAELHDYPVLDLQSKIIDDLWNKPAYLLSLVLDELRKPEGHRVEWLFWFDRDTVILNPCIPLHIFLPPRDDIHIVISNDWNGLNNGVFGLRVNEWSARLLSTTLGYRELRPDEELRFTEQSAMEKVLQDSRFKQGAAYYPQRWFNAYEAEEEKDYAVKGSDLLVHFAGVGDRLKKIADWIEKADSEPEVWSVDYRSTSLPQEIFEFWNQWSASS
ncbi:hypothetical protein D6C91_06620 [Aureobasidium pullulans]|uniref:Galactosyl transferase GMA12/MNN10 family protein n=1 Tax=Aureobasidium pullulans TaxID=5580 RepID=A0A4S9SX73_AURPU|nr:hypothetical protein D6C91_06620 [Aureobasidium pullulans]